MRNVQILFETHVLYLEREVDHEKGWESDEKYSQISSNAALQIECESEENQEKRLVTEADE